MKILVTGANGFIGKNLIAELKNRDYSNIYVCDRKTTDEQLIKYTTDCEFVFHLAGVNRPIDENEFAKGNVDFTFKLLESLKKNNNKSPILVTSSIQAKLDNAYGKSKKECEDLIFRYKEKTGSSVFVYRLPNVFGKWCKPNYNSVIATFCYNISRNLPITVNNANTIMNLVYIDDVVEEFISALNGKAHKHGEFCSVETINTITLGEIVDLIYSFKNSRKDLSVADMNNVFEKKLYSTYLSYLPKNQFMYDLDMHIDQRGSFTEFIRTNGQGQVSVNIAKPGIVKGNHWHHTKNEKFLVVSGKAKIRFRKLRNR